MSKIDLLLKEVDLAILAMKSAWYELEPGGGSVGAQFIPQDDMDKRIAALTAAVEEFKSPDPESPQEVWVVTWGVYEGEIVGVYADEATANDAANAYDRGISIQPFEIQI